MYIHIRTGIVSHASLSMETQTAMIDFFCIFVYFFNYLFIRMYGDIKS